MGEYMRQLINSLAIGVIALLLLSQPYSSQSGTSIEGFVLEGVTERPLQGVTVVAAANGNTRSATTDAQGHFLIDVPESGRYLLTPGSEGMVYSRPASPNQPHEPGVWVQVSSSEHISDVSLRMVRAGVISGRVLDSNGKTFSAVRGSVSVMRYSYDAYGKRQLRSDAWVHFDRDTNTVARMDDQGDYRLYGLQPGDYYVNVSGGGNHYFYPGTPDEALATPVHVRSGEEVHLATIILPAQANTPVRFHFSDAAGNPLTPAASSALSLTSPDGGTLISGTLALFPIPDTPTVSSAVRSVSLPPGPHDYLVGLVGMGATPEVQYGRIRLNIGNSEMDEFVTMSNGIRISGSISAQDVNGNSVGIDGLVCKLHSDLPHVESVGASTTKGCFGAQYSSGLYQLEVTGMPPDAYIESATADGKDILAHGLQLSSDTEIKVRIRALGGKLDGIVRDTDGKPLPEAAVALVPDAPLRDAGTFYRFVISDVHGKYQLRGIAPGSYHVFAWTELNGAAYRNAEFMKAYYEMGTPVTMDNLEPHSRNIVVLNQ